MEHIRFVLHEGKRLNDVVGFCDDLDLFYSVQLPDHKSEDPVLKQTGILTIIEKCELKKVLTKLKKVPEVASAKIIAGEFKQ
jgi:hypothetical protein